jgi:hypothetical protein
MYQNMDQDDVAEINPKSKVKTVQLEIQKDQIETLQKRYFNKFISFSNFLV